MQRQHPTFITHPSSACTIRPPKNKERDVANAATHPPGTSRKAQRARGRGVLGDFGMSVITCRAHSATHGSGPARTSAPSPRGCCWHLGSENGRRRSASDGAPDGSILEGPNGRCLRKTTFQILSIAFSRPGGSPRCNSYQFLPSQAQMWPLMAADGTPMPG